MKKSIFLTLVLFASSLCFAKGNKKSKSEPRYKRDLRSYNKSKTIAAAKKYTERQQKGCKSDDDCVVYCGHRKSCCGALCVCTEAFHRDFVAKMKKQCQKFVKKRTWRCPVAKCPAPGFARVTALCARGTCETRLWKKK